MDKPLAITNTAEDMTLDSSRSGTTTFTVHSTEAMRGRAELLIGFEGVRPKAAPAKPAAGGQEEPVEIKDPYEMPDWLEVDITGVREHEFGTDDTKEYAVQLSVPGGKASGTAKGTPAPRAEGLEQPGGRPGEASGGDAQGTPAPKLESEEQAGEEHGVASNPLQVEVAGATPGPYWIRLDMVDVENPDETRVLGPRVSFEVPGRPFPWWIVAVAAGVLVIVAVGVALLLWSRVTVPDVGGQPVAKAEATLQAAGLTVTATMTTTSETVMRGLVVNTTPGPKTPKRRGSGVALIWSVGPGKVAVPNVLGLPAADAVEALMHAGFTVGPRSTVPDAEVTPGSVVEALMQVGFTVGPRSTVPDAEVTPGWVVVTTPGPGTRAQKGSEVALVLSSGPEMVRVPDVKGQTEETAKSMLAAAELDAGQASTVENENPKDQVVETRPQAGTLVPKGSAVGLVLSSGPKPPTIDFYMGPRIGQGPLKVTYRDLTERDPEGWDWDFGDGQTSSLKEGTLTYTSDGTYTVTLTVKYGQGESYTWSRRNYVTVEPSQPVAYFVASSTTVTLPDSLVTFTDTSKEEPTSWYWNFGDGATSTEPSPDHQFQWAGTFFVTLEISNTAGLAKTATPITVERPDCLDRYETEWVSEEYGGPRTTCGDGFVACGVQCRGDRCDDMSLICCRYHLGTDDTAQTNQSDWSPEYRCWKTGLFGLGPRACTKAIPLAEPGKWLKGLQCRGGYCSMVKLEYLKTERLSWNRAGTCNDATSLSSTKGATSYATCDPGWYLAGLTCFGDDCSQIRLLCCPAQ